MIWQMTYTHKLPKLCLVTLTEQLFWLDPDERFPHPLPPPYSCCLFSDTAVSTCQRYRYRQDSKMAAAAPIAYGCPVEFEDWLSSRLKQLGLDEDVFGSYVTGVLDSEDTDEERKDALIGILEGMTVMHVFTRDSDKTDLKLEIT